MKTPRPKSADWKRIREEVFKRDNFTCRYCSSKGKGLHCDHKTPISRGGSNDMSNLVTACDYCNRAKSKKTVAEFLKRDAWIAYLLKTKPERVTVERDS